MLVGEPFNSINFDEDNYDYHFKRKQKQNQQGNPLGTNQPGRFKKIGRKNKRSSIAASSLPMTKKRLIQRNFGLSKRNIRVQTTTPIAQAPIEKNIEPSEENPLTTTNQDPNPLPESTENDTENAAQAPADENSIVNNEDQPEDPQDSYDDDYYDEAENASKPATPKTEPSTDKSKKEDKSKDSAVGENMGWVFLGLTVLALAYVMYKTVKDENHEGKIFDKSY